MRRLVVLFATTLAWTQTFEVASLKPSGSHNESSQQGGPGSSDPERYRYTGATLEDLIVAANRVEYFQVSSKIAIDRDRFDLIAKLPPGATRAQFRVMLQTLLADRFRLKFHRETRDFPGYELVVGKSGSKLDSTPKPPAEGFPDLPPDKPGLANHHTARNGHFLARVRGRQVGASEIARALQVPGDAPVVDRTGLTGKYDFTLEYSYDSRAAADTPEAAPAPSIFTAVQQQLGLQLVPKRLPFEVLVIDSFDRTPSAN